MCLTDVIAHGALPHWSPFAVIVGAIGGFVLGAYASGLYALWLQRRQSRGRIRREVAR